MTVFGAGDLSETSVKILFRLAADLRIGRTRLPTRLRYNFTVQRERVAIQVYA